MCPRATSRAPIRCTCRRPRSTTGRARSGPRCSCRSLAGDGEVLFDEETSTESMCRSIDELIAYMRRDNPVPAGSVLLTGTGLVPPDDVTLTPGYTVEIRIPE